MNGFEAAALSKAISASLVIPCHYDLFDVGNSSTPESFPVVAIVSSNGTGFSNRASG